MPARCVSSVGPAVPAGVIAPRGLVAVHAGDLGSVDSFRYRVRSREAALSDWGRGGLCGREWSGEACSTLRGRWRPRGSRVSKRPWWRFPEQGMAHSHAAAVQRVWTGGRPRTG